MSRFGDISLLFMLLQACHYNLTISRIYHSLFYTNFQTNLPPCLFPSSLPSLSCSSFRTTPPRPWPQTTYLVARRGVAGSVGPAHGRNTSVTPLPASPLSRSCHKPPSAPIFSFPAITTEEGKRDDIGMATKHWSSTTSIGARGVAAAHKRWPNVRRTRRKPRSREEEGRGCRYKCGTPPLARGAAQWGQQKAQGQRRQAHEEQMSTSTVVGRRTGRHEHSTGGPMSWAWHWSA